MFLLGKFKKKIRIVGGKICDERDSDDYFSTRLRGSQIGRGHQNSLLKLKTGLPKEI